LRFTLPCGLEFEIPEDWWRDAGAVCRARTVYAWAPDAAHPALSVTEVAIAEIEPLRRSVPLDFGGFRRDRLINVLRGLATGAALPPIRLKATGSAPFRYKLNDGFHRFYGAAASGFERVPAIVYDWYES
jgi:hypothetical protein